ncbi:Palmitoyltransferase ZDHHC3 (Acyltransferase ZDHHC3) (Zinc finger DHHC domain-containing protein 3) [Durusdinium trenchii]|uniref:Palmitoyltransferase n=1 Tax=Durusdinium trenchii TaxID=1381693 RepID=A0ABP0JJ06_9DINO
MAMASSSSSSSSRPPSTKAMEMQMPVERPASRPYEPAKIWCICDGCGIVCLCIAYTLLFVSNVTVLRLGRWPLGESFQFAFTIGYEGLFVLSIWSHLACMLTDPGACPLDVEYADGDRHCTKCRAPKPARAHHCSTCRRCIMKMDHHCPWVNNCVGAKNQKHFLLFLFYTSLQCVAAALSLGAYFADSAVSMPRRPRKPSAFLAKKDPAAAAEWLEELKKYSETQVRSESDLLCCVLIFFVAIIFGLFTCIMACDQVSNITSNTTGIDVMKGKDKEAVQRPWRESVQEVMGRGPSWRWLLPTPLRHTQEE